MLWDTIREKALQKRASIAIGVGGEYADKTVAGAEQADVQGLADVTVVSSAPLKTRLSSMVSEKPEKSLVGLLKSHSVDGIVRGSLGANAVLTELKSVMGLKRVMRVSLLKTPSGRFFFFAPVGVDEGWTVEEKVELGELGAQMMREFGAEPRIGVLSGGRTGDRGRSALVDKTLDDAEEVARLLQEKSIYARHAEILFEDAVNEYNYIIAPDGISGNLIFRALCLVGGGEGYGAPIVNADFVYVDTSRAGMGYENAICLAGALAKKSLRP